MNLANMFVDDDNDDDAEEVVKTVEDPKTPGKVPKTPKRLVNVLESHQPI